jgi:hypothetical protein
MYGIVTLPTSLSQIYCYPRERWVSDVIGLRLARRLSCSVGRLSYPPRERWVPDDMAHKGVARRLSCSGVSHTHLVRGEYEQKPKRLQLCAAPVGHNIRNPPLTRWVCDRGGYAPVKCGPTDQSSRAPWQRTHVTRQANSQPLKRRL